MNKKKIIIIIILLIMIIINYDTILIYKNDLIYFIQLLINHPYKISKIKNITEYKKNKLLFITYDNRKNIEYIDLHNQNLKSYCNKWNYDYKFFNYCKHNTYWCKLYLILNELESNSNYDYIIWLDSDTIINNFNFDINITINLLQNDIFIAIEKFNNLLFNNNITTNKVLCAGVFIIKNSIIGRQFIKDCLNYHEKNKNICTKNNKLNGLWAGMCYEQGVMNHYIRSKYLKYTTILDKKIINNSNKCNYDSFILHYFGKTTGERNKCFRK